MTTDEVIDTVSAYEEAFGEETTEALIAPNYLAHPDFIKALSAAVKSGVPLTPEQATERFGPPVWSEVI